MKQINLMQGDNILSLKKLPDNSVDSVVTDAPYGLGKEQDMNIVLKDWIEKGYSEIKGSGFMGKEWDAYVPQPNFWKEVYRVLKPGGHLLCFFGTRTYDIGTMAIRLAGFEIRDQIMWLYGSGFPKSHNIGKSVDKIQGNEREAYERPDFVAKSNKTEQRESQCISGEKGKYTKGTSEWEGWGSAMKPANEPICVARKPLSEKTIALNVLKWGTGGINIDGCRVGSEGDKEGRFPANIILDEEAGRVLDEQSGISKGSNRVGKPGGKTFGGSDMSEDVVGKWFGDKGGASRFFYQAKVSKKERNMGLDNVELVKNKRPQGEAFGNGSAITDVVTGKGNSHPTVKPVSLMAYLVRLVTPPNGIVLDPFMGSGSTGIAARLEGFRFVGMEMDEDYFKIATSRIENFESYREFVQPDQKLKNGNKRMASRGNDSNSLGLGICKK